MTPPRRRVSRRELLAAGLAALLGPSGARAQPATKVARVGILASSGELAFASNVEVFRKALRELGWIEGRNLSLEVRYATEGYQRLPVLASELVGLNVDVIFALASPAARAAKQATTTIPIVMETLGDAVSTGLVRSLARPGGNVTGLSGFAPELTGKQLELIREILPRATRVALLANGGNTATAAVIRSTESAAARLGVRLHVATVRQPGELDTTFETIARARSDALIVAVDPMFSDQRQRIVELAARHRLPTTYGSGVFPEVGGLLSYGQQQSERFRRAAVYVDRILKGASPGDLPVEQPSVFQLVLNLKIARSLGLQVPDSVRLRADQVIE
jgi:putative tryptophan/tyrosine transport system substrate-binding protein